MTKLERKMFYAVLAAAGAVVVSGVTLARRRAQYLLREAAIRFGDEDPENLEDQTDQTA